MAGPHAQLDIPAISIFDMPLNAPPPSTFEIKRDHIQKLHTLISVIKGIYLRDVTTAEWPWYAFYDEVLRHLCLSLPRTRGSQRRLLYLVPQGRVKHTYYKRPYTTEQWSLVADWSQDIKHANDNPPVATISNINNSSANAAAATNDPSHLADNPTVASSGTGPIVSESADFQSDIASGEGDNNNGEGHNDTGEGDNNTSEGDNDTGEGDNDTGEGDNDTGEGDIDIGEGDVDTGEEDVDTGEEDVDTGEEDVDTGEGDVDTGGGDVDIGDRVNDIGGRVTKGLDFDDALLNDEQAFHQNFIPAKSSPDVSTPRLLPPGNISPTGLSTNVSPIERSYPFGSDIIRGVSIIASGSALFAVSGLADNSADFSANALSGLDTGPLSVGLSQLDNSEGNHEGLRIVQESLLMPSTPASLGWHVPLTATRPRNPKSMTLIAEGAYSSVKEIPSSTGHPILVMEVKPLAPECSQRFAKSMLEHAQVKKQTSIQACLSLDEHKMDAITAISAAGLWVKFDEYRRDDVIPFLGRPIPGPKAPLAKHAKPSSSSEVLYLFRDDMSDYSPRVMDLWRNTLQLA